LAGLFRDEVLQERRAQFLGAIRIARNPSFTLVTAVALLLAAALGAYATWGEITRKARLAGVVVAATVTPSAPGSLAAHLYATSRTVAFVQPGQPVRLRLAAYPYQKFGMARGTVRSVSHTPLSARDLPAGAASALPGGARGPEPLYVITVALETSSMEAAGRSQPLQPGMALEADVAQERRRIWEWLLEPALAASGKAGSVPGPAR
jgi:membrane fusion protein